MLETTVVKFRRARSARMVPILKALQSGEPGRVVSSWSAVYPGKVLSSGDLARLMGVSPGVIEKELEQQVAEGRLIRLSEKIYGSAAFAAEVKAAVPRIVEKALGEGIAKEGGTSPFIASMLKNPVDPLFLEFLLRELVLEGRLTAGNRGFTTPAFLQKQTVLREDEGRRILAFLDESGGVPLTLHRITERFRDFLNRTEIKTLLDFLVARGEAILLENERYLSRQALDQIKVRVRRHIEGHGSMTLRDCGDVLGYGRDIGVTVLEYLDSVNFTFREGNERFLKF